LASASLAHRGAHAVNRDLMDELDEISGRVDLRHLPIGQLADQIRDARTSGLVVVRDCLRERIDRLLQTGEPAL
jgi:hypothetical protein